MSLSTIKISQEIDELGLALKHMHLHPSCTEKHVNDLRSISERQERLSNALTRIFNSISELPRKHFNQSRKHSIKSGFVSIGESSSKRIKVKNSQDKIIAKQNEDLVHKGKIQTQDPRMPTKFLLYELHNEPPASIEKESSWKLCMNQGPDLDLQYDVRVAKWTGSDDIYNPVHDTTSRFFGRTDDPKAANYPIFLEDKKYADYKILEDDDPFTIYRKTVLQTAILREHTFGRALVPVILLKGLRFDREHKAASYYLLPGEVLLESGQAKKGAFTVARGNGGVIFHAFFTEKNIETLTKNYQQKGFYPSKNKEHYKIKIGPCEPNAFRLFNDGSYICSIEGNQIVVHDPRHTALLIVYLPNNYNMEPVKRV